ncbi:arsenate reductase/protein-tyrosine-phosphatase family protein [Desertihabitans aurantiacus]|uniref:arsenate reductase/protein-tyrosine-phosphatase family protein n=1 Tax=Desertihabitans aurantiacus TaxID=2282477 RepID=UPI00130021A1|nr:low molecular weight phosphatase family protein [Desertihabitans aurantiacus]
MEVLVVCTGNVCRSPAVELLLRRGVDGRPGVPEEVRLTSAGIRAMVGEPMAPRTVDALGRLGVEVEPGHHARQLTAEMVARADLVLAASRLHRSAVVQLQPEAVERAFTVTEFARYCSGGPQVGGGLPALASFAVSQRGLVVPRRPEDDDLRDPWGKSARVHRAVVWAIADAVADILAAAARPADAGVS